MDWIEKQAIMFRNYPLLHPKYRAVVHLEDKDDEMFWNAILQHVAPMHYKFISYSKNNKGNDTRGCEQCLKYRPYLSNHFFICIDSDMRYISGETGVDVGHYVCQTYTYSWENHYCEAKSLQAKWNTVCKAKGIVAEFDMESFLQGLSHFMFRPLLVLIYLQRCGDQKLYKQILNCLPTQCKREDLANNGKVLLARIEEKVNHLLESIGDLELEDEKRRLNELGIDETNAYLHIRGHNLFDLLKYIGLLLTKGSQVSFYKEILTKEVSVEAYWEKDKIEADIKEILKV